MVVLSNRVIGGEKILASREGAAVGGGQGGDSAAPERSAGAKRSESVSFKKSSSRVV